MTWFVDKLGPRVPQVASIPGQARVFQGDDAKRAVVQAQKAAGGSAPAAAQARPQSHPAPQPQQRAATPAPAPEPEKKKKKGWF